MDEFPSRSGKQHRDNQDKTLEYLRCASNFNPTSQQRGRDSPNLLCDHRVSIYVSYYQGNNCDSKEVCCHHSLQTPECGLTNFLRTRTIAETETKHELCECNYLAIIDGN